MAKPAVAREALSALRREIARIEGTLPERLEEPLHGPAGMPAAGHGHPGGPLPGEGTVLRRRGVPQEDARLSVSPGFDAALGGGLPPAALTEIHARSAADAGAASGFALALAALLAKRAAGAPAGRPLLWIGTGDVFAEVGLPYAPGLEAGFGIAPDRLLICRPGRLADALWIAEEAARLTELVAVFLETRGNPPKLDLTATRRLCFRAKEAGRPVFLIRQGARAEPTAAPVRLVLSPASAGSRATLSGPLEGSIGPPAFHVLIGKGRAPPATAFTLEWNPHELAFHERHAPHPGAVVPPPADRQDMAAAAGAVVAFGRHDRAAGDRAA